MLGNYCGDIVGSIYERNNIKKKDFDFFSKDGKFTDDSVMTCAIADASLCYLKNKDIDEFQEKCIKFMQYYGRRHINAGYGGTFIYWLMTDNPKPYNSFGNGSAMRVSPVAWVATSLEEAENLAAVSASVSHNHRYGLAGAQAVAGSIWLLLNGYDKDDIREYVMSKYFPLNFSLNDIRDIYKFDVSCQGSVPQAIVSFLESDGFEDTIRNAISIGGDSDTIAAIAGGLAEAYYGIPKDISVKIENYLDSDLKTVMNKFYNEIYLKKKISK